MSHLRYKSYDGWGQTASEFHMSQVVRVPVGEIIKMSGQGGWDVSNGEVRSDLAEEYRQAFDNVQHTLMDEGGVGFFSVYKLVIYYTSENELAMQYAKENMLRCFPDHHPVVTMIGVEKLALPGMRVEVDAEAHMAKEQGKPNDECKA
ncbi:hypothetical protein LTR22_002553 [Elasticomyces elasticus]|nr:hypothetical protein LTR22_002553 [Elasticomyces elasticus]